MDKAAVNKCTGIPCRVIIPRINPVCLPIARADHSVGLLPEGYDQDSKILTTG